jgi:hypothetical protein
MALICVGFLIGQPDPLMNPGWPNGKIPAEIPEYTSGKIINSGGDATDYYIKIEGSTEQKLGQYLDKLEAEAWIVQRGNTPGAVKGLISVNFNWYGGSSLQMAVHLEKQGAWPADKIPGEFLAPGAFVLVGDNLVTEVAPNSLWTFFFECAGMDQAAAGAYMRRLIAIGWEGDETFVNRYLTWKGKKCEASVELVESNANSSKFSCNWGVTG